MAELQNGDVHVFWSLQSVTTNANLSLVMYFKEKTSLFFQEIYYFMSIKMYLSNVT